MPSVRLALAVSVVLSIVLGSCADSSTAPPPPPPPDDAAVAPDLAAPPPDLATRPDFTPFVPDDAGGCPPPTWEALDRLSPEAFKARLDGGDVRLVKVHLASVEKIPGTDVVLDPANLDAIEAWLGHDRCAELFLYCYGGRTSQQVGDALVGRGYRRVHDLVGGLLAWKAAGYPLQQ